MSETKTKAALEQAVALLERMIGSASSDAEFTDENYAKSIMAVLDQAYDALDGAGTGKDLR